MFGDLRFRNIPTIPRTEWLTVPRLFMQTVWLIWTSLFLLGLWNLGTCYAEGACWTSPQDESWALHLQWASLVDISHVSSQLIAGGRKQHCCVWLPWGRPPRSLLLVPPDFTHMPFLFAYFDLHPFAIINGTNCWVLWVFLMNLWTWGDLRTTVDFVIPDRSTLAPRIY